MTRRTAPAGAAAHDVAARQLKRGVAAKEVRPYVCVRVCVCVCVCAGLFWLSSVLL